MNKQNGYNYEMKEKITSKHTTLQERLSTLMEMRGLNKSALARIAGVSPQAVTKWFDRGDIGKSSAMKIASIAGVSVDWILEGGPELHELNAHRCSRLKEWFGQKGFPDKEFAFFEDLINGKVAFTDKTARRIEKDYAIPLNYLDAGFNPSAPIKLNDIDKDLLYNFHKLTSDSQREILEIVKKKADFYDRMFEELSKLRS